jgi:hypothetical protein
MGRLTLASLAVAASLAIPAATATAAGSGWSKPATLAPTGKIVYQPSVAIAPNGTTVAVWTEYNTSKNATTLVAAIRTPRGKISKYTLGSAASSLSKPGLAVGGDGTFAVTWAFPGADKQAGVAVKVMPAGHSRFGTMSKVASANVSTDYGAGDAPVVAVDDAGTVYVAWEGTTSSTHYQIVETQRAKGARAWSSPLHPSTGGATHGARIAANGKGKAVLSWGETNSSVWADSTSSNGRFGPAQEIAGQTYESTPALVGISDAGKMAIVWEQAGSKGSHQIAGKIGTSTFPSRAQSVSSKGIARYQALAIASNGSGAAAWETQVAGGWEVDGTWLGSSAKSWGKSARLTPTGYAATFGAAPAVAANNRRAVIAWSEKDVHHGSFVGATVHVGSHWSKAAQFPGLSAPVVAVPSDPVKSGPVAAAMIWLSTKGLQISILKP